MCGSMMITSATKPTRASMMTSRNTVLLPPSSSSNRSRPRMALSELDRGGQELDRAALEQAHVDHQPEMQERADQSSVERYRHAADQGRDHRADGGDLRGRIGAHSRERDDEADHGAGQAEQHQAVRDMADRRDPGRELELQARG